MSENKRKKETDNFIIKNKRKKNVKFSFSLPKCKYYAKKTLFFEWMKLWMSFTTVVVNIEWMNE